MRYYNYAGKPAECPQSFSKGACRFPQDCDRARPLSESADRFVTQRGKSFFILLASHNGSFVKPVEVPILHKGIRGSFRVAWAVQKAQHLTRKKGEGLYSFVCESIEQRRPPSECISVLRYVQQMYRRNPNLTDKNCCAVAMDLPTATTPKLSPMCLKLGDKIPWLKGLDDAALLAILKNTFEMPASACWQILSERTAHKLTDHPRWVK